MGKNNYINPIINVDYSDPDVCRVGDDYFMVASSFCNAPGLPLLHSKDLVNWKLINYCIDKVPGEQFDKPMHGCGVWAPAIRYHNSEFIVFFPMPDEGIYVVKTKDPWGKWGEPVCLLETKGWIDPCPFWDDDGRCYMISAFAKSRIGFNSILNLCEITTDCLHIIDKGQYVFDGNIANQETIEGPKMYKRNGYYYIFAPAGGVKQGWQTVLRSKNIWGPYEHRVVMEQKDSDINGPHQGAWIETVNGENWFIHFQDVYATGRIVHLQPLRWEEDWPIIGDYISGETCGKPVREWKLPNLDDKGARIQKNEVLSALSDDFNKNDLDLEWQWNANPKQGWYDIDLNKNQLVLYPVLTNDDKPIGNMPNLLLRKWHGDSFQVDTKLLLEDMKPGDVAGIVSLGITYGAIAVKKTENDYELINITGNMNFEYERAKIDEEKVIFARIPSNRKELCLRIMVTKEPPVSYNTDGKYTFPIPSERVTLSYGDETEQREVTSFLASAGRWVGVKHGLFCFHDANYCEDLGEARWAYYRLS